MRHRTIRAFTLLELLVVLGIIAALMGILLSALSRAREMGKRTVCLSNIRQLQMAWLAYAYDNKGRFCTARVQRTWGTTGADGIDILWPNGINAPSVHAFTSWIAVNNAGTALDLPNGRLWPYARDARVYFCPNDNYKRTSFAGDYVENPYTSYAMNGFMGNLGVYSGNLIDEVHGAKLQGLNQIKHPAGTFVFIEVDPRSFPNYFLPPYYGGSYLSTSIGGLTGRSYPASFHLNASSSAEGCMISFADGHAIFWKYNPDKGPFSITAAENQPVTDGTVSAFYSATDAAQMEAWSSGPIPPGVTG